MKHHFLGVGALNLDIIAGYRDDDDGMPLNKYKDTETDFTENEWWKIFYAYLNDRRIAVSPGGSAANTATALKAIDKSLRVTIVGSLGSDVEAQHYWEHEHLFGVKYHVKRVHGRKTGRAFSYIGEDEPRTLAISAGANRAFCERDVPDHILRSTTWLHVTPFVHRTNNIELGKLLRRARMLRTECIVISVDPGTFLSKSGLTSEAKGVISQCDYIFTKSSELKELAEVGKHGDEGRRQAAVRRLIKLSMRPLTVVVERLPEGFTVYRGNAEPTPVKLPVPDNSQHPVNYRKDDTGAGDVFNAAYVYSVMRGLHPKRAAGLISATVQRHVASIGRSGFASFSSCAPVYFVSHSSKDKMKVRSFIKQFSGSPVSFWFDDDDIEPGQSLRDAIKDGVRQCDALLVFITPDAIESTWVSDEIALARKRNILIIGVVLSETDIPDSFRADRYIDAMKGFDKAKDDLLKFERSARSL
jgi:sugar/nucleoside kinase (ribokinase family)